MITPWRPLLFTLGALTMLFGGWAALRQTDLKLVLAYGTVSQLGLLVVVAGAGTPETALAAAAMLLAHGLFKSTLFLVVGIVDHQAGTRELPELSGVGRRMPGVAVVATLAAASMAGVPPLFGFVAKEAVFQSLLEWPIVLAALVAGTMLTVAYSARFLWGAFASKPGVKPNDVKPSELGLFLPPAVLAVVGLALGPLSGWFEKLLKPYTELFGEASGEVHLGLWHGLTPALGLSALALLVGGLLFAGRRQITPLAWLLRFPVNGARAYEWVTHRVDRVAIEVTGATQRGSLPQYLGTILIALIAAPGMALLIGAPWPDDWVYWHNPLQLVVVGIMSVAALLAVRARRRLTAMLLVGVDRLLHGRDLRPLRRAGSGADPVPGGDRHHRGLRAGAAPAAGEVLRPPVAAQSLAAARHRAGRRAGDGRNGLRRRRWPDRGADLREFPSSRTTSGTAATSST